MPGLKTKSKLEWIRVDPIFNRKSFVEKDRVELLYQLTDPLK